MLLFKKKFLPLIRSGEKKQTIRVWKHRRMRGGQRSYIPGVGYIRVLAVDAIDLDEITDEDARLDGLPSAKVLLEELSTLYADKLEDGCAAYRVRFEVLPDETPAGESTVKK